MSVTRIPQDDVIAMFLANVEKVERQNRLAPVAIELAVQECSSCVERVEAGVSAWVDQYGDVQDDSVCRACNGFGKVGV